MPLVLRVIPYVTLQLGVLGLRDAAAVVADTPQDHRFRFRLVVRQPSIEGLAYSPVA